MFAYAINPYPPALGKKISTRATLHLFSNTLFHSLTLFTVSQLTSAPKREFLKAETSEDVPRICDINFPERLLTAPHADMLECYCFRLWTSVCNLCLTHSSLNLHLCLFFNLKELSVHCQFKCIWECNVCQLCFIFSHIISTFFFFGQMIAEFH